MGIFHLLSDLQKVGKLNVLTLSFLFQNPLHVLHIQQIINVNSMDYGTFLSSLSNPETVAGLMKVLFLCFALM
jgi:uncharacterized protein (DUF1778 family)